MIYAMLDIKMSDDERLQIAQAVADRDRRILRRYCESGRLIHIMDLNELIASTKRRPQTYCFYCMNVVWPSHYRGPKEFESAAPWHFEHPNTNDCISHRRRPPVPFALEILNPAGHGCYAELGCELQEDDSPAKWHRTNCHTISDGKTYCHLARRIDPSCF